MSQMNSSKKFAIAVHGGAGGLNVMKEGYTLEQYNVYIKEAAQVGYKAMEQGASAVDAVELSIRLLEDNPAFNAGTGACLTSIGTIELDAMIMDGFNNKLGSVGCVDCTKNPISLARLVMDNSCHCMMVANGARIFAINQGYPVVDSSELLMTQDSGKELEKLGDFASTLKNLMNVPSSRLSNCDTVGAVALDKNGALACATSTGGVPWKLPGRVGDAPIVGAGGFANLHGSASCTGHGESLMKATCCRQVVSCIEMGRTPHESAKLVLDDIYKTTSSCGGVICMDSQGNIGIYHSSEFMSWAYMTSDGVVKSFHEKANNNSKHNN